MKRNVKTWVTRGILLALVMILAGLAGVYFVLPARVAASLAFHPQTPPQRTPRDYRLAYEEAVIPASNGVTLAGWWMPPASRALGTVVMSHGVFKNREQVMERAGFLVRAGYRVLVFDLRGHGASTRAPLTAGVDEAADYAAALRYLDGQGRDPGPRVLFGLSLSAMAALRAAAEGASVGALVLDSPLPDAKAYLTKRTPAGPFMGWPGFFDRCLAAFRRLTGRSLTPGDMDILPLASRVRVPVMQISGEKDDLVPATDAQRLFNRLGTNNRRLLYVPEAGHDETYRKFRVMYERGVLEFLREVREGFPKPQAAIRPRPTPGARP